MNEFDQLIADLETLSKSMPGQDPATGDGATQGDGKKPGEDSVKGDGEGADQGTGGEGETGEDALFGKSFEVTLPDGSKTQAVDATQAVVILSDRVGTLEKSLSDVTTDNEQALKALTMAVPLVKKLHGTVSNQEALIKSLRADVQKLGNTGTGRRAALSIHEKPAAGGGAPRGLTREQIMSKAMDAFDAGRINSLDVSRVETRLSRGLEMSPDLAKAIGI